MLIALEGIDGSGKQTQAELLRAALEDRGLTARLIAFPRYGETTFAQCITGYLNGQLGDLASVDPRFAALLFAGDRLESSAMLADASRSSDLVILDRYVASNLAHQAARVEPSRRSELISWISRLEHEMFALPYADLTLYLDTSPDIAATRIQQRNRDAGTSDNADIHESNLHYLTACRETYQELATSNTGSTWITIKSVSPDGRAYSASDIHAAIWSAIEPHVTGLIGNVR